ncbi:MAG: SDR family oxidoreductase [Actinobacteria bacterium]|nr:SDR family oxidoreductase [Actinomycetota bacterium]
MEVKGKVALVTGSGSAGGIGRSTVLELAGMGAGGVVVNYANPASQAKAEAVAAEAEALGARALIQRADVSDDRQCRQMVERTVEELGQLDILVNNAATTIRVRFEDLEALTDEVWDLNLNVNLKGPFYCIRAARPYLEAGSGGAVVNVSSIAGIRAVGSSSIAYAAAKAGVINMTMFLARALAPVIRVNCVTAGFVKGQWMEQSLGEDRYEKALERTASRIPMGRVAKPQDVAQAICSLISSDFITGQNLICDGGFLIRD